MWHFLSGVYHQGIPRSRPDAGASEVMNRREADNRDEVREFLTYAAHAFYSDWDLAADTSVAILHTEAGRDPHDKGLHDLVGEL
jgi:hypothetical protein